MKTWQTINNEAHATAQKALAIHAKYAGKSDDAIPPAELKEYERLYAEALSLKAAADQAKKDHEGLELLKTLAGEDGDAPDHPSGSGFGFGRKDAAAAGGSTWAREVKARLEKSAGKTGVKALLTGEINTPPAVEVVELPRVARRLLDLIAREPLTEATFSYLRQVVRTNNAAVVADNATKPTSTFTFEEFEDKARVIAHLSEPFPLRYAADYASMMMVLDNEMLNGVLDKLEQQIMSGAGGATELPGILTLTGVTNVAYATDKLTTIRKARTALEAKGEQPNAWVLNPTDAESFDLMREDGATGGFLLDSAAADTVFGPGIGRVTSLSVPAGQAVLADWSQVRLLVREEAHTLAATQAGDLFDKNQMKLRSEGRFGIKHRRPQAIAVVDLTA